MIQLTPQMRILVAVEPVDFRKGIDGLVKLARQTLGEDPFSGCVFVYRNRRATSVRLLVYDGQGFWLCHKRLSSGRFSWWPTTTGAAGHGLEAHELQVLLYNGDPVQAQAAPAWRRVSQRPAA
jgi:transposase